MLPDDHRRPDLVAALRVVADGGALTTLRLSGRLVSRGPNQSRARRDAVASWWVATRERIGRHERTRRCVADRARLRELRPDHV